MKTFLEKWQIESWRHGMTPIHIATEPHEKGWRATAVSGDKTYEAFDADERLAVEKLQDEVKGRLSRGEF